jgi:diguanylate cyclase (GGDEF)-like protein
MNPDTPPATATDHEVQRGALVVDIDEFYLINNAWGREVGDALLSEIALRIDAVVGADNSVRRFGGDEFVVVAAGPSEVARDLAKRIRGVFAQPFITGDARVYLSATIGFAVSDLDGGEAVQHAETAMYAGKSRGRGRIYEYDDVDHEQAAESSRLAADLHSALHTGDGLSLNYQPVVEMQSGHIVGVEALCRWRHRYRGDVSAAEFLGAARTNGLSTVLDRWVIIRAVEDLARLRRLLGDDIRVGVNVTAEHLGQDDFEQHLQDALTATGASARGLVLEISESALLADQDAVIAQLDRLRQYGVTAAVDHLGAGYSAVSNLDSYPFDVVKIDANLVARLPADAHALAMIMSVLDVARSFDLYVVAAGIETAPQLELLRGLGCPAGQGFLWSPAVSLDMLDALVAMLPGRSFEVCSSVR